MKQLFKNYRFKSILRTALLSILIISQEYSYAQKVMGQSIEIASNTAPLISNTIIETNLFHDGVNTNPNKIVQNAFTEVCFSIDYKKFDLAFINSNTNSSNEGHIKLLLDITVNNLATLTDGYYKVSSGQTTFQNVAMEIEFENIISQDKKLDKIIKTFPLSSKIKIEVKSIWINNTQISGSVPSMFALDAKVYDQSYVFFNSNQFSSINTNTYVPTKGQIDLAWDDIPGAEFYELEWTFVDQSDWIYSQINAINYDKIFERNAVRVLLGTDRTYQILIIYPQGRIIYRVRGVGYDFNIITGQIVLFPLGIKKGKWSLYLNTNKTQILNNATTILSAINGALAPSENWQAGITFAEKGLKKEVVSYFDHTLRQRQAITRINTSTENSSNNTVLPTVVAQTIYDFEGRPVIQTLPTPVHFHENTAGTNSGLNLNYKMAFVKSALRSNQLFDWRDFDIDASDPCTKSITGPVDTLSGPGKYYSRSNDFGKSVNGIRFQGFNHTIANARQYPFTQIEYAPDNTGRIFRQGGVGPEHQLHGKQSSSGDDIGGKETQYYYSKPLDGELKMLFGSDINHSKHYEKTAVVDPNGQMSISIMNSSGKVIATSLDGLPPKEDIENPDIYQFGVLPDALTSNRNFESLIPSYPVVTDNQNPILVAEESFIVSKPGTHYLKYEFSAKPFSINCNNTELCVDCEYILNITVADNCGKAYFPRDYINPAEFNGGLVLEPQTVSGQNPNCKFYSFKRKDNASKYIFENLPVGTYYVTKTLTINNSNAKKKALEMLNKMKTAGCIRTLQDYKDSFNYIYNEPCMPQSCESCNAIKAQMESDFTQIGSEQGIAISANEQKELNHYTSICNQICNPYISPCELLKIQMKQDIKPNGQYAKLEVSYFDESTQKVISFASFGLDADNWKSSDSRRNFTKTFGYNIYNRSGIYIYEEPKNLNGSNTDYKNEQGQTDYVLYNKPEYVIISKRYNADGSTWTAGQDIYVKPKDIPFPADFIALWKDSWADALLYYHPEKCYLNACNPLQDSYEYDTDMLNTNTFEEAKIKGFFKPFANTVVQTPTALYGSSNTHQEDAHLNNFTPYYATFKADVLGNSNFFLSGLNIYDYVNSMAPMQNGCYSDDYWHYFRAFYLSRKLEIFYKAYYDNLSNCPNTTNMTGIRRFIYDPKTYMGITSFEEGKQKGDDMQKSMCQTDCDIKLAQWTEALKECNLYYEYEKKQLLDELKEVCLINCNDPDATTNNGANTLKTINGNSSFEDVFKWMHIKTGRTVNELCSPLLLNLPNPSNSKSITYQAPADSCGCDSVILNFQSYQNANINNKPCDYQDYASQYLGWDFDIKAALCYCKKTYPERYTTANFPFLTVPVQQLLFSNCDQIEEQHQVPIEKCFNGLNTKGMELLSLINGIKNKFSKKTESNYFAKERLLEDDRFKNITYSDQLKSEVLDYSPINTVPYSVFLPPNSNCPISGPYPNYQNSQLPKAPDSTLYKIEKVGANWNIQILGTGSPCKISIQATSANAYNFWDSPMPLDMRLVDNEYFLYYVNAKGQYIKGPKVILDPCFDNIKCCQQVMNPNQDFNPVSDVTMAALFHNIIMEKFNFTTTVDGNGRIYHYNLNSGLNYNQDYDLTQAFSNVSNQIIEKIIQNFPNYANCIFKIKIISINENNTYFPTFTFNITNKCGMNCNYTVYAPVYNDENQYLPNEYRSPMQWDCNNISCGPTYWPAPDFPLNITCKQCFDCDKLAIARSLFASKMLNDFGIVAANMSPYQYTLQLTNFINAQYKVNFDYAKIYDLLDGCANTTGNPPVRVYLSYEQNNDIINACYQKPNVSAIDPCLDEKTNRINHLAEIKYNNYIDALLISLSNQFSTHCASVLSNIEEEMAIEYPNSQYHFTLYYYDMAGQLTKTVPPAGVSTTLGQTIKTHSKITRYQYNALGQIDIQLTPDAGKTQFWYDWAGRMVASQNKKQQDNITRRNALIAINHYFTFLCKNEEVTSNPTALIKIRGTHKRQLYKIYSAEELTQLYDNYYHTFIRNFDTLCYAPKLGGIQVNQIEKSLLARQRNYIMLGLLVYQGLATNEIQKINVADIDTNKGTIKISSSKKSNERTLILKASQIGAIINYIENIRPKFFTYCEERESLFFALPESSKQKTNATNLMHTFKPLTKQVKSIDKNLLNFKQIRASVITGWLKIEGLRKTQYYAGHRYISSTEKYLPNQIDGLIDDIAKFNPF